MIDPLSGQLYRVKWGMYHRTAARCIYSSRGNNRIALFIYLFIFGTQKKKKGARN